MNFAFPNNVVPYGIQKIDDVVLEDKASWMCE